VEIVVVHKTFCPVEIDYWDLAFYEHIIFSLNKAQVGLSIDRRKQLAVKQVAKVLRFLGA